jgi:hypothetical protein
MPALKLTQNYQKYALVLCLLSSPKAIDSFTMAVLSFGSFLRSQNLVFQSQNFRDNNHVHLHDMIVMELGVANE